MATSAFTYDTLNRIDTLTHKQSSTTLDSYDYDFDGMSRITKITNGIDGVANYTYDKTSQLTAADNPSPLTDESYTYDANGNRTSTGYTINSNNQTAASPGYTYTYDDEGNRTKRTETATGHVEEYTYDYRNRLTAVKFRNTAMGSVVKEVDYAYDYQNRMIKRAFDADGAGAGAPTYQYWVYDDSINAVLQFDGAAASNLSHRYLWANGVDALLADEQVTSLGSGGNTLWALSDNQGSVRDLADLNESTGVTSITNHRTYNSFDKLTSETNAAIDLVFGYTGKYLDDATGYQNNVNRWYDSNLGQWFSEDPKGFAAGDENLRRYVNNNVLIYVDKMGLDLNIPLPPNSSYNQNATPKGMGSAQADIDEIKRKIDEVSHNMAEWNKLLTEKSNDMSRILHEKQEAERGAAWENWNYLQTLLGGEDYRSIVNRKTEEMSETMKIIDAEKEEVFKRQAEILKLKQDLEDAELYKAYLENPEHPGLPRGWKQPPGTYSPWASPEP